METTLPNHIGRFSVAGNTCSKTDACEKLDERAELHAEVGGQSGGEELSADGSADERSGRAGLLANVRKNAWTWAASIALVGFTTFVLLDTFALERVEQTVQDADFSSIVATQDQANASSADANADASAGGNAGSDADASADANAVSKTSDGDSQSKPSHAQSKSGKHGKRSHSNSSGFTPPSGSSTSKGASSSGSKGTSEATTSVSAVVAGAASATSAGTEIGTYSDENMQITVSKVRSYETDIYVADVQVSSAEYLKTALAQNSFGRNLKDTTSNMANAAGAILAVNGDYYGFRDDGYVLRNGVLYRDTASSGTDALVVYGDGTMAAASQDQVSAETLKQHGAWQVLSFGPVLVDDGQIAVEANEEVGQSKASNPRTAIGMVSPLHYVVVVSDGRTDDNEGLSLYELSQVLIDNGATFAYNLDGGGSTTLFFKGEVLNNPTSGNVGGERKVSDIVYFG